MIDNELEFDRLAEGGEKTFLSAKKKRMMVSLLEGRVGHEINLKSLTKMDTSCYDISSTEGGGAGSINTKQ
jgi:hypothetical protein